MSPPAPSVPAGRTADRDVVVLGDGPAGAAAAAACRLAGLDTLLVGPRVPWTSTYGAWTDELDDLPGVPLPERLFEHRVDRIRIAAPGGERVVDRQYGIVDGGALQAALTADVDAHVGTGEIVGESDRAVDVRLDDAAVVRADRVVLATGAPPEPPAWQTAFGVFVDPEVAARAADLDAVTLMDWRWTDDGGALGPTFGYVVPVGDRWLVEHTVLAAEPMVPPDRLRDAVSHRLGEDAVAEAEAAGRVERVVIPMGVPPTTGTGRVIPFGMAAGLGHPASGYSVTASLRAAPRLATALSTGADPHEAVWPEPARRARVLHDYGLAALLRLDAGHTMAFFSAFFELPVERWSAYLRVDTTPSEVATVMLDVFRRVPWSVRRRLASGDVGGLIGVLRGFA